MQLDEAIPLVSRLIATGEKHQDYSRTVDLACTYQIYITGLDIAKKLKRFVPRESDVMFTQRCEITKAITPAVAASLQKPFSKVTRNNRIRTSVKMDNETRQKTVEDMIKQFYGAPNKDNRGLSYWMNSRFLELNFTDPNAWMVLEWDAPDDQATPIKPRPFEVSAKEAVNFFIANDIVKWLFVQQAIVVMKLTPSAQPAQQIQTVDGYYLPAGQEEKKDSGSRFTLYDTDVTVVFEEVDAEYIKATGYALDANESYATIKDKTYVVKTFTPKIGFPPVYRIGYVRDVATKARTFVNPWHDALCYFDKSLKTVSELDLTMTLHAFPQKLQYVQKCTGPTRKERCNNGLLNDGSTCPSCNGSGHRLATTAQDAILLPMPETKDEMVPLEDILVYKSPPVEIIAFQNDYVLQLERQAHQAVFNSQVLIQATATNANSKNTVKTATEINTNLDSVYDALEPFTEKYSELYMDVVYTMGILTGEPDENINVVHEFPADYKMKGEELLLAERVQAQASGAPVFLLQAIDEDLAAIIYQGDEAEFNVYHTKKKYYPFNGLSPDEIAMAVVSDLVPKAAKVLYYNFETIFTIVLAENPDFYNMDDPKKQTQIVKDTVDAFMKTLDPAPMALPGLGQTNPLNTPPTGTPGDANPAGGNADPTKPQ